MKLTRELLHPNGLGHQGHNRKQLAVLGVSWPAEKGWLSALIGTEISEEKYAEFVRLGYVKKIKIGPPRPPKDHADLFQRAESPEDFANNLYESTGRNLG